MKLGKYLHYKGKYYEVIGEATHSETLEKGCDLLFAFEKYDS